MDIHICVVSFITTNKPKFIKDIGRNYNVFNINSSTVDDPSNLTHSSF